MTSSFSCLQHDSSLQQAASNPGLPWSRLDWPRWVSWIPASMKPSIETCIASSLERMYLNVVRLAYNAAQGCYDEIYKIALTLLFCRASAPWLGERGWLAQHLLAEGATRKGESWQEM